MRLFFKHNGVYLSIYVFVLAVLGYILLTNGKVQIHKALNTNVGNIYIDTFFKYITYLGDGLVAFFIACIFLFINMRVSIYILISYLGAAIVSYILKHVVYNDIYRPHSTFEYFLHEKLNEVEGVDIASFHSFPSGHALSAFALFFCLLFVTKQQRFKVMFFLLAFIASFSRIYLSQHWLIDVYVGSIIGVSFSLFFYTVFYHTSYFQKLNTTLPKLLSRNKTTRV